jgi:2-polyprenyl-6-methoxyphenol hydroxylase-like FAD-dependent oxidoreductase
MHVAIVGAGPAGLYLAYLLKRRDKRADIRVFEQNASDATFGFGVVFSDRALEFLNEDDPETFAAIAPRLEFWHDITLNHRGESIVIDGVGFAALGRLELLQLLQQRARSVGVEPVYRHGVKSIDDIADADLIVGADGINSIVRRAQEREVGTAVSHLSNRFAWFGTTQSFATLTQTFRLTEHGAFNAHHYRYAPGMSTFIVEVDEATFHRCGFDKMPADKARRLCEEVFADALCGHTLISNNSVWRQFPKIRNQRWSAGNLVLLGDALHTAHFSIGSGTRLAMEDAIALDKALAGNSGIASALQAYEATRRPIVEKLVSAADASADWYENFASHLALAPIDLAMSYIRRSGRVDLARLQQVSPLFVARYKRERSVAAPG